MSGPSIPLSLAICFALVRLIEAQCVTSGYVPCLPTDGGSGGLGGVPDDDFDNSDFWDSLQGVASLPIGKRDLLHRQLAPRQNALCCKPTNQCLVLNDGDIPFCYDTDTTRYVFSDESFGYLSNGTYYAADGTFVDFKDGHYSMTDGTTGTFAPATAAATSSDTQAAPTRAAGAHAASTTTASALANHSPTVSSSTGITQQTSTPNSKSGGVTVLPASKIGWLGLCLGYIGVFLG